jgi:hypothetical protein
MYNLELELVEGSLDEDKHEKSLFTLKGLHADMDPVKSWALLYI